MEGIPIIDIVVPMRNEKKHVHRCVQSLLSQKNLPGEIEILCVDGRSTDGTREIVDQISRTNTQVKLLDNPQKIVPSAMNIGIKAARGEYIIRADCHSEFSSDYVAKCLEVLQRTGADNVGGYWTTMPGEDTAVGRAIAAATSCGFGVGNSMFRLRGTEREVDTVPFGTYRKQIFEKIGLYDERLVRNQDIELNSRIQKSGGRIVISPDIKLTYFNRSTYKGCWQQAFNNGLWNPYTIWLVGNGLRLRHFVPMVFVSTLIVGAIAAFFWPLARPLLLGYILLYLGVAIASAVRRAKQTNTFTLLILLSFIILHVAYGLGSLWGILTIPLKFPKRRGKYVAEPLSDRIE